MDESEASSSMDSEDRNLYHLAVYRSDSQELLGLREESCEVSLPSVMPATSQLHCWELNCDILVELVEKELGVEGTVLGPLWRRGAVHDGSKDLLLVIEVVHIINLRKPDRMTWVSVNNICNVLWKPLHPQVHTGQILSNFLRNNTFFQANLHIPVWRTIGWFKCAKRWVHDVLALRDYHVRTVHFIHNRRQSTVLIVKAVRGVLLCTTTLEQGFFVKACGQGSREPVITRKIWSHAKDFVPEVIAVSENWNCFVQFSAGNVDFSPDPVVVLTALARLQKTFTFRVEDLAELGMQTFNLKWIIDNVENVMRYPATKHCEGSTRAEDLAEQVPSIKRLCRELDAESFPTTLVHGDMHLGNVACTQNTPGSPPIYRFFDWGAAFLGHPLFDVYVLLCSVGTGTEEMNKALERYLCIWKWRVPISHFKRMLHIAGLCYWILDLVHTVQGCQKILDGEDIVNLEVEQRIRRVISVLRNIEAS